MELRSASARIGTGRSGTGRIGPGRIGTGATQGATVAEVVREAWAEVLDQDWFDPDDDFFALGGDSISAAQVARRVGGAVDVHLPVLVLHRHPTIAGFTAHVESLREPAPVVAPRPDPATHPLDPGQQRLWLLNQLHPDRWTYTVPMLVELVGPLDRAALSAALDALVVRHEPLRTTVAAAQAGPVGRVRPPEPMPLETARAAEEAEATDQVTRFLARPFALADELPVRVLLIQLDPNRHWLVFAIHHIATDGESLAIIREELGRFYDGALAGARTDGVPAGPAPLAATFGDVVAWHADRVAPDLVARLDRQRAALRGYADRPLALEGPNPDAAVGVGARTTRWLGPRLTEAVRAFAYGGRTTVFVTMLAGFAELTARWSGGDDVCLGYPVSVREPTAARELVGFFIATRVLRLDASGGATFAALVDRAHAAFVDADADAVPFDALAEAVAADSGRRGPLFRVWFNHEGQPERPPAMDGLVTRMLDAPVPPALFDLNVYLTEHDDDLRVDLVHDTAHCSRAAAREILDQYVELLAAATADGGVPVRRLRPRTAHAAALLPDACDPLWTEPASGLARRLTRVARVDPGAVAINDPSGECTYAELRAGVRAAAGVLRTARVRPGDTVAVHAERGRGLVTAILAVWSVGGRLLLLDPGYPPARLARNAALGRTRCLVSDGDAPDLGTGGLVWLRPGQPARMVRAAVDDRPEPAEGPEPADGPGPVGASYLSFTSGTTGEPVGVVGTLGPIEHFLDWYSTEHRLGPQDRFALLAGVSHDPVFRDVLLPLWTGGTLCVPSPATHLSPADLAAWLRDESVTVVNLTPPLARLLIGTRVRLPALRLVCLAGDAVTAADVAGLSTVAPGATVLNGYGTTETPQLVSRRVLAAHEPPSLGAGAPGSQLLVVDPDAQPCGIGETGRIVVRSRHLAARLLTVAGERERLTADAVAGVSRFDTGDLGRHRTDGTVAYLGRTDQTVNVRGFRVDPLETDAALGADPRVSASATVSRAGADGTELVSYVVAQGVTATQLRARLAQTLPAYLVPAGIVFVDRLPLTRNGKVDREALRTVAVPTQSRRDGDQPLAEADGPLEQRLARIWSVVLGLERLDVTDNFFDLGGTSLTMLRLHAAIRREIDDRVPLLALYQNPSVRALARSMAGAPALTALTGHERAARTDERARRIAARRAHAAAEHGGR